MIEKNYCIVYLYKQTSQIDYFHRVHKILRWIGSSDFKLYNVWIILRLIINNNLNSFLF